MSKQIKGMVLKVLVAALAITPMSVWANTEEGQVKQPSTWAREGIVDAEAYGVLPVDFVNGLTKPITEENMEYILKGVRLKLESLGFSVASEVKGIESSNKLTREAVLLKLYNELLRFDLSDKFTLGTQSPIEWMKTRGIIEGDERGLGLNNNCSLEEALTFATRFTEEIYAISDQGAKGLIWEVTNGNNKVYLLGTIHMGQSMLYPVHQSLDNAFKASDAIAFEVDFNNQEDMQYLIEQQSFTDGTTLKDYVSGDVYKEVTKLLMPLGLTDEQINLYKPMTLANVMTMLSAKEEPTSELPLPILDIYFQSKTKVLNKELIELEGIRYQTDFLYNAPMDTQVFMLEDMVKSIQNGKEETHTSANIINEWLRMWAAGDEGNFSKSFPKNEKTGVQIVDDFNGELFDKRDKNMTDKVLKMLNSNENKTYMVIVGAGHMIGETGIVKALQKLGYSVKPYNE